MRIVLQAPYPHRWFESQIAGMVGRSAKVDEEVMRITFAAPLDGSPLDGATLMELRLEPLPGQAIDW